ncbi:MAG: DinB family protein [Ignavibacteriales bacterium]|nr:DinB family protein [Ignavibacteriales bacterium]
MLETIAKRLEQQHLGINHVIAGLDDAALRRKPQPDKWNIVDNIAHIASYQLLFTERMQKTIAGESLTFGGYVPEQDARFLEMQKWSVTELLASLEKGGLNLCTLLNNATGKQLANTATHLKYGSLNVTSWAEFYLLHEAHHMFTIFKLAKGIL